MTASHKDYKSIMSILYITWATNIFALSSSQTLWLEAIAVTANKDLLSL